MKIISAKPTIYKDSTVSFGMKHLDKTRFGFAQKLANGVSYIEADPLIALMSTDLLGMVFPRTGLEYYKRGHNAGRETFIREATGTVSNVFLVGWVGLLSAAVSSLLFDRMSTHSKGIPVRGWLSADGFKSAWNQLKHSKKPLGDRLAHFFKSSWVQVNPAWIHHQSLQTFSEMYQNSLKATGHLPEARQHFVRTVLSSLRASDRSTLARHLEGVKDPKVTELLTEAFKEGRLETDAIEKLLPRYLEHGTSHSQGLKNIEALIRSEKIGDLATDMGAHSAPLTQRQKAIAEAEMRFNQKRLIQAKTVVSDWNKAGGRWQQINDYLKEIHHGGLSNAVDVVLHKEGKETVMMEQKSLETLVRELDSFLTFYVDRATAEAKQSVGDGASPGKLREQVIKHLAGAPKEGWLNKILPSAEDSLIHHAMKMKNFLVGIPLVVTILFSISIPFINNMITRYKNGGKDIFPGEEVYKEKLSNNNSIIPPVSGPVVLKSRSIGVNIPKTVWQTHNLAQVFEAQLQTYRRTAP